MDQNVRSELCSFSPALPSTSLLLFSMPPLPCALENKVVSAILSRGWQDSSVPLAQTSTSRSSSSFLFSKYLFRSAVARKRSVVAETEEKSRSATKGKLSFLNSKLHRTVAGADRSWKEKKRGKLPADKSVARLAIVPVGSLVAERHYQILSFSSWVKNWVASM